MKLSSQAFITYGDDVIRFEQRVKVRGNKRVGIKVYPDCRVVVSAPPHTHDSDIQQIVMQHAHWIYTQLQYFQAQQVHLTPRCYISGESHRYLGKQYVLKVIKHQQRIQEIKLLRGQLVVSTGNTEAKNIKQLLHDWYKVRAKVVFQARLEAMLELTPWVSTPPPIRLRIMKSRWGSCSPQGNITLNTLLIKTPRECIDYVIIHELCHLVEHNHSPRFYRLMTRTMPQWRTIKARLDNMATIVLHN